MRGETIAVILTMALSGCAGAPAFTRSDYVETKEIFRAIERELCEAVDWVENTPDVKAGVLAAGLDIRQFVASATVGLAVAVETSGTGSASLVVPVSTGSVGISGLLDSTVARTRDTVLKVYYPFGELECDSPAMKEPARIAGNLGLADWIRETTKILFAIHETPVSYSYSVSFSVTNSGSLGPSFQLLPGSNAVSGNGRLSAARELVHSLSVTVVEIRPDEELAQRYQIPDETRRRLERESDIEAIRAATR